MQFLGRLAKFWLLLSFVGSAGYFGFFNRSRIPVTLPPWFDELQVPAYAAYVMFFLIGAFVTTVYLGLDNFKKGFEIRKLTRQLRAVRPEVQHLDVTTMRTSDSPSIDMSAP